MRLYDHLFASEDPGAGGDFRANLNPDSLRVLTGCKLEPALAATAPGDVVQFERRGYFCRDTKAADRLVFNRTVTLRDTWARIQKQQQRG